jgi:hypothetical protein
MHCAARLEEKPRLVQFGPSWFGWTKARNFGSLSDAKQFGSTGHYLRVRTD